MTSRQFWWKLEFVLNNNLSILILGQRCRYTVAIQKMKCQWYRAIILYIDSVFSFVFTASILSTLQDRQLDEITSCVLLHVLNLPYCQCQYYRNCNVLICGLIWNWFQLSSYFLWYVVILIEKCLLQHLKFRVSTMWTM